jgi:hypothetical protein
MTIDEELELARERGYIVARESAHGRAVAGRWWHECFVARTPYIRVTPRKTWADVRADMEPVAAHLADAVPDRMQRAMHELCPTQRGWRVCGRGGAHAPSVPLAAAEPLAMRLSAIMRQAIANGEIER